ncbi:MAG: SDR family oxidoreductase [Bacteroidetes bacterium]|nr:SDR family oxidoreductase [Bacteroidota bacterium]
MSVKKFTGALITGGARGIGFELAKNAALDCETIVIINMNESVLLEAGKELEKIPEVNVITISKDLSTHGAVEEIFNEIKNRKIQIDILINNAGIGAFGEFRHLSKEKNFTMLQLNIIALTDFTKLFINEMISRKNGYILNIASLAAFQPGPLMAVYYASKAYVLSFSQSIARELKGTGVSVTALCPGPTKTYFQTRVGSENSWLSRWSQLASADEVAGYGYRAMLKRKTVAIPGILNSLIVFMIRFIPRNLLTNIVYMLQKFNRQTSRKISTQKINEKQHKNAA